MMLLKAVMAKACDRESAPETVIVNISPEANHHQCRGLIMFYLSLSALRPSARKNSNRAQLPKWLTDLSLPHRDEKVPGEYHLCSHSSVMTITRAGS